MTQGTARQSFFVETLTLKTDKYDKNTAIFTSSVNEEGNPSKKKGGQSVLVSTGSSAAFCRHRNGHFPEVA